MGSSTLTWMHVAANALIALSYFSIPILIVYFIRKRADPSLVTPGALFALFITACGITHLLGALSPFLPIFGLMSVAHVFTAVVSVVTAVGLFLLLPGALSIPTLSERDRLTRERDGFYRSSVTKQAEIEARDRDLASKYRELEAANDELRRFSYAASHDLKSPANTLALWLDDFRSEHGAKLGAEGLESIEDAAEVVERMRTLVEDILIYSRIANRAPDQKVLIDLRETIETVVADQRVAIRAKGAKVTIDMPGGLLIEGHPSQISMLFVNLISNSLTFAADGTTPEIDIRARYVNDDRDIAVTVSDNGIGIDAEHSEKIFSIFSRLHPVGSYKGNGLGLALCRRIAVGHGGSIALVETDGPGATFEIILERKQSDVRKPQAA